MKTLLIDGNSLIHRAFYALPLLSTEDGTYTNAVYGFLKMFYRVADEYQPDHVVCAFDVKQPTFRHQRYAAYKAGRKKMPEELVPQIPLLKEILTALGVRCAEAPGFEADDIIGTYSLLSDEEGGACVVLTGDRDALQLISENTTVWLTKKGITEVEKLTPEGLLDAYGLTPAQICDLKGLMGDSSDNIPGIAGVGEKTALSLLEKYRCLENVLAHAEEIPGKLGEKIRAGAEAAKESKFLATIVRDVEVAPLRECVYTPAQNDTAAEIFTRYQMKSLLERTGKTETRFSFTTKPFEEFTLTGDTLAVYFTASEITLCCGGQTQYSLALAVDLLSGGMEKEAAEALVRPLLEDQSIKKVFYDSKQAMHFFSCSITNISGDVMLAEYLTDAGNEDFSLARIAEKYHTAPGAAALLYIFERQQKELEKKQLLPLYREIELPLARVLFDMERVGFFVDADILRTLGSEFSERISELSAEIFALSGRESFNINSPKQLGEVLFGDLGLPAKRKTKTGYSTAADVLEKLSADYPIVRDILEYRGLTKLKSTYADGLAAFIEEDGRIHTNFNQTITATGRISSTEPNLQNIPMRMELGRQIRKVFIPREGYEFMDADYSQIELRVLAHMSGDEQLIDAYRQEEDIHRITASKVFHTPFEKVTDLQRRNAKAVNFGIVYGISSFGLSQDLSISKKEAAQYIEQYFATYPKVKEFIDKLVADAKEKGYTETMFGRRRPIPELSSSNFMQRSFGERVAMNAPIQGTAADIIKIAMIKVWKALKEEGLKSRLILQVHDELLIETAQEEEARVREILTENMKSAADLAVTLEIDLHTGNNWYEAK